MAKAPSSKFSIVWGEIVATLMAIILPAIPAIVMVALIVAVDFIFGIWKTVKRDLSDRKKIKLGLLKEDEVAEYLVSSQLYRTLSKLLGFTALCVLAATLQYAIKDFYNIPFLVATILYIAVHEVKSIDENFKEIFGWGIYTGFLKLLNREPIIISKDRSSVKFDPNDKKPTKTEKDV